MPNMDSVTSHLQIINTWASFARERDLQLFTEKHLESIEQWTSEAIALLKEQEPKFVEIDGQFGGIKYGRCPKCGKGLNEEVYPHWCGFCGSGVKWK